MDDACKRAIIRKIADALNIPIHEMYDSARDAGPSDDELARIVRAFSRITHTRTRQLYLEGLEMDADRDGF